MKKDPRPEIPPKAVYRLSLYFRCLQRLKRNTVQTVSSDSLARAAGVKPTQLRKDLTYFGQFGRRGLGYDVDKLSDMISDLLGTTSLQPVILVGVGNLGAALLTYRGFAEEGFEIVGAFDLDPQKKKGSKLPLEVRSVEELPGFIRQQEVKLAILAVPATAAQESTNQLVKWGVIGILNFAPVMLQVPDSVKVNNVNLAIELEHLSYYVKK